MPRTSIIRRTASVNLTAMADITFVLLCFIMFTGKFRPYDDTFITAATTKVNYNPCLADWEHVLLVRVNKHGHIFIDSSGQGKLRRVNASGLFGHIKATQEKRHHRIVLKIDAATPFPIVKQVFAVFKKAKQYRLHFYANLATH
ncbi:biopolymer transporter ExbD [uncultured Chitinophaga sp.]|uniref:ExbD/TolR family protein n=1 Tax=uncultured Chitinophaga sp. TaxID=339340 RepID=UPI0025ECF396|nr:biopolymer transporter ExbD [uncultured Chitinophaga sp.]